jgi:hypothetical protein
VKLYSTVSFHGVSPPAGGVSLYTVLLPEFPPKAICCIIVESPDRFARDLTVQLIGHDFLKNLGIALIPATAPGFFTEETPTACAAPSTRRHRAI